jgi:hypothetical protein
VTCGSWKECLGLDPLVGLLEALSTSENIPYTQSGPQGTYSVTLLRIGLESRAGKSFKSNRREGGCLGR